MLNKGVCKHCHESAREHVILAMLIDLGCITQDPSYCPGSEDHKHEYQKLEASDGRDTDGD